MIKYSEQGCVISEGRHWELQEAGSLTPSPEALEGQPSPSFPFLSQRRSHSHSAETQQFGVMLWNPSSVPRSSRLYIISVFHAPVLSNLRLQGLGGSDTISSASLSVQLSFRLGTQHLPGHLGELSVGRTALRLSVLQVLDVVVNEQYPVSTEARAG